MVFTPTPFPKAAAAAAAAAASVQAEPQMVPVKTLVLFIYLFYLFLFIWYTYELFWGLFYFKNEIRMEEILQNCNFDMGPCITQFQYIVKLIQNFFIPLLVLHLCFLGIIFIQKKKAVCLYVLEREWSASGHKV